MSNLPFCTAVGSGRFAALLNQTSDALYGVKAPGLERLADDKFHLLVEGGKWKGCWSQNYYGMICTTPLLSGKLLDYHLHTLEIFFEYQGDGKTADENGFTAPPGALPEYVSLYKGFPCPRYKNDEGSGLAGEFDFWVEGNAASVASVCDVLLAMRNREKSALLLPKIEKCLEFILSRKDPATGLLKVGVAGTLIERAYGATFRSKGVTEYGLPAGAAANTIYALRLAAEVEEFAGNMSRKEFYLKEAEALQKALAQLIEKDSCLINYLDADGIRHGVPGASRHGYFETNCNHDAAAWGVIPERVAVRALKEILDFSPTPLAPCVWKIHDDTHWSYQQPGDEAYGGAGAHWNGAAWFSSQGRYIYALLKYGLFDGACAAGEAMQAIYDSGTMRDLLIDWGESCMGKENPDAEGVYYIDGFGAFGGVLRGVAGVEYKSHSVKLSPHLPAEMSSYKQLRPYYWGGKELFMQVEGTGTQVCEVLVNGKAVPGSLTGNSVLLEWDSLPEKAEILFKRV
ncbi:MAG: hypothetical protein J6S54_04540 [Lentisphaeria bacterium]|nr:hypothetical protein [Lentisphaeria bacterium]